MKLLFSFFLFFVACASLVVAQPILPSIDCQLTAGKVSLAWMCQYDGVKVVIVKRSADSMHNYESIGVLERAAIGAQHFIDTLPLSGVSFYKIAVIFNSDLVWHSNHCRITDGSDSLSRLSKYVIVNPGTGHVDVTLPDEEQMHLYSLVFYDRKGGEVLRVSRLKVKSTIIDKRNFQRRGFYRFELRKDRDVFEAGYIQIKI
jgi:hypothetical protein